MSVFTTEKINSDIEEFSEYAKFDDLNELIEESKRRFLHKALSDNDYSLHRTARNLGYSSVNSTILTLFDLNDSDLKSSKLKDFFENNYKPNEITKDEQAQLIQHLSQSENRKGFDNAHSEIEKIFFESALEKHNGNHTLTAEHLDMGRKTISRKIKKYKISIPETPRTVIASPEETLTQPDIEYHSNNILNAAKTYPNLKNAYEHTRRHMIMQSLKQHDYNVTHASQSLGWTRATFRENYTNLFDKEKFQTETVNADFEKWQNSMSEEPDEIKNATILFIEQSESIKNVQSIFKHAKAKIIQTTVENHDDNKAAASKEIGLNRATIAHHLKKEVETSEKPTTIKQEIREHPKTATHVKPQEETKPKDTNTTNPITEKKWVTNTFSKQDEEDTPPPSKPKRTIPSRIDTLAQSLSDHFAFSAIFEAKEITNRAFIAETLKSTDFNITESAGKLGTNDNTLRNLISNHFKIIHTSVGSEERYLSKLRKAVEQHEQSETKYDSTIRDILPEIKTLEDISDCFTHASKHIVTNTWKNNEKDTEKTAFQLGISPEMTEAMIIT